MTNTFPSGLAAPYLSQMQSLATQYNIPLPILEAVIWTESTFNPNALSPAGAYGLAQLEPATAQSLGVNIYDPSQNLQGGAELLAQNYKATGNWNDALRYYNGGTRWQNISVTQDYANTVLGRAAALGYNPSGSLAIANSATSSTSSATGSTPLSSILNSIINGSSIDPASILGQAFTAGTSAVNGAASAAVNSVSNAASSAANSVNNAANSSVNGIVNNIVTWLQTNGLRILLALMAIAILFITFTKMFDLPSVAKGAPISKAA